MMFDLCPITWTAISAIAQILMTIATFVAIIIALRANTVAKQNSKNEVAEIQKQNELLKQQEKARVIDAQNNILLQKREAATVISILIPQIIHSIMQEECPPLGVALKCDYCKYLGIIKDELTNEELAHLTKVFSLIATISEQDNKDIIRTQAECLIQGLLNGFPAESLYCQNMAHNSLPSEIVRGLPEENRTLYYILRTSNSAYCSDSGSTGIHSKLEEIASRNLLEHPE